MHAHVHVELVRVGVNPIRLAGFKRLATGALQSGLRPLILRLQRSAAPASPTPTKRPPVRPAGLVPFVYSAHHLPLWDKLPVLAVTRC